MAEDDEVDVLGDYSFDVLSKNDSFDGSPLVSQNSDLLNCDYTIHPQWLLDKPSTNPALWYDTSDLDTSEYDTQPESAILPQQNSITDESGWTEKEKDLLNRGIEIFGKSNVNLSQFIGSRTPAEVKYFLKNFYSDVQLSCTSVNEDILFDANCIEETVYTSSAVLQDNEIPASIEQIIQSVSTANPTTPTRKICYSGRRNESISYDNVPSGQSLLKSSYTQKLEIVARTKRKSQSPKVKFKTKLKFLHKNLKPEIKKASMNTVKKLKPKQYVRVLNPPVTSALQEEVKKDLRIITGNGLGVPVCEGEEVVKIIKENDVESESDVEIDIEDADDGQESKKNDPKGKQNLHKTVKSTIDVNPPKENVMMQVVLDKTITKKSQDGNCFNSMSKTLPKRSPQLEEQPEAVLKELMASEYPQSEVILLSEVISEVEKFLFFEFFEGRPTKTPQRYLHIRNHILESWNHSKPKYLRKTTIRNGLKQAGDVNLIGRIHSYLEQIGAINFGCEQTNYYRPLLELATVTTTPKEKQTPKVEYLPRQRIKKKYVNDGEGGYTLTHDEKGKIINTTVVNEEQAVKQRSYLKRPAIQLIYCRPFSDNYEQQYSVSLDLSTLILMDLHAHMYLTEVMGLIGGYWNASSKTLLIKRYVPCKNVASSLTHCDMCPLSQARAADLLHTENLDILGWYHSHPTFAPEPSQQDMDTQLSVQQWIGSKTPSIGFILSPFSLHGALIASPYRCMIVRRGDGDSLVPYKFKVDLLVNQRLDVEDLLRNARRIFFENTVDMLCKSRVDFTKAYFQDNSITYLDKYIYSVKMHLAKCSNINKMTCDAIIEGLANICARNTTNK